MKKHLQDSLVIGFALFSMFFGAGNVIFPPYLGLESGPEWLAGFFSYFMADIGLALLAMFAILRQGSPDGITARIGRIPSTALMCAIVLCIGPMLAIPRTAATTYETSLAPLVSGFSPALFSILFFLLILLLCVRETAVVDIVGKILTPALLIGLLILIVVAVLAYLFLWKTSVGFQLRAVGSNSEAARAAGIPVNRYLILSMTLSGGIAAIAGVTEMFGKYHRFIEGFSPSFGFTGIAVAILGKNHPVGVILTALLFGMMDMGALRMSRETAVSSNMIIVVQSLVILFVSAPALVSAFKKKRG